MIKEILKEVEAIDAQIETLRAAAPEAADMPEEEILGTE